MSTPSWGTAEYFETIRMVDIDGDGGTELCARGVSGWRCYPAQGDDFGPAIMSTILTDAEGWQGSPSYWSTILSGGRCYPIAESCNDRDDDCDGLVDEDVCAVVPPDASSGDASSGGDAASGGEDTRGGDDTSGGNADTRDNAGADAGPDLDGPVSTGCACRAGAANTRSGAPWYLFALGLLLPLRRRGGASRELEGPLRVPHSR